MSVLVSRVGQVLSSNVIFHAGGAKSDDVPVPVVLKTGSEGYRQLLETLRAAPGGKHRRKNHPSWI